VWGIVPAAGAGTRIQPLAFSKELLPVGSRVEDGVERPRAVSEYLVERMVRGGATRVCFVVSPGKADILAYYGGSACSAHVSFTVQPQPAGLCDALFRALPMIPPATRCSSASPTPCGSRRTATATSPTTGCRSSSSRSSIPRCSTRW
jgi:dTDP-glucose pyrophosphorylase